MTDIKRYKVVWLEATSWGSREHDSKFYDNIKEAKAEFECREKELRKDVEKEGDEETELGLQDVKTGEWKEFARAIDIMDEIEKKKSQSKKHKQKKEAYA